MTTSTKTDKKEPAEKQVAGSAASADDAVDTKAAAKAEREAAAAAKKAERELSKAAREAAMSAKKAEREAAKLERVAAREASKAERAAARAAGAVDRGPNRESVLAELKQLGWDGPTSYTKTRLVEMVETIKEKGVDGIERASKGRPAADKTETAA